MNNLKQVAWITAAEKRLADLEKRCDALLEEVCGTDEGVAALKARIEALEAKRGPGRPKNAKQDKP